MARKKKTVFRKRNFFIPPKNENVLEFLRKLQKASKRASARKKLIKNASGQSLKLISECALNFQRCNLKGNPAQTKLLNKHKKALQKLASNKTTWRSRKRILSQKGGFLAPLLSIGIPVLSAILKNV
jgi:hypothetical protein